MVANANIRGRHRALGPPEDPDLQAIRVSALTTFDSDREVFDAVLTGAAGYVLKDIDAVDLRRAVRVIASGGSLLSPSAPATAPSSLSSPTASLTG